MAKLRNQRGRITCWKQCNSLFRTSRTSTILQTHLKRISPTRLKTWLTKMTGSQRRILTPADKIPPCYPSSVPVILQGPSAEISIKKENDIQPEQTSAHVILPNIKRIHKTEELEMSFNDYSQAKKSRESIPSDQVNQESTKAEALKMFLLSMLPDLQAMSDEEVRLFKRKSLEVIDDIISARLIPQVVYSSMSPSNTSGYKSEYIKTEDSD
uniref:Polypeptide N-acetylgalactosaminyltransferase 2 n=1 Tax=Lygus hesperus TaxID=30085 RepID=A0A0A9Y0M6_LYGHE